MSGFDRRDDGDYVFCRCGGMDVYEEEESDYVCCRCGGMIIYEEDEEEEEDYVFRRWGTIDRYEDEGEEDYVFRRRRIIARYEEDEEVWRAQGGLWRRGAGYDYEPSRRHAYQEPGRRHRESGRRDREPGHHREPGHPGRHHEHGRHHPEHGRHTQRSHPQRSQQHRERRLSPIAESTSTARQQSRGDTEGSTVDVEDLRRRMRDLATSGPDYDPNAPLPSTPSDRTPRSRTRRPYAFTPSATAEGSRANGIGNRTSRPYAFTPAATTESSTTGGGNRTSRPYAFTPNATTESSRASGIENRTSRPYAYTPAATTSASVGGLSTNEDTHRATRTSRPYSYTPSATATGRIDNTRIPESAPPSSFPMYNDSTWDELCAQDPLLPRPSDVKFFGRFEDCDTDVWVGVASPVVLRLSSRVLCHFIPALRHTLRSESRFRLKNDGGSDVPRYGLSISMDESKDILLRGPEKLRNREWNRVDGSAGRLKTYFIDFLRALHGQVVSDVSTFLRAMEMMEWYFDCSRAIDRCLRTVETRQSVTLEQEVEFDPCGYLKFSHRYYSERTFKLAFEAAALQTRQKVKVDVTNFLKDLPEPVSDMVRMRADALRMRKIDDDDGLWKCTWDALEGYRVPSD